MTLVKRQTRRAQVRLWLNRWFVGAAWCATVALAIWAAVVLVERLFAWGVPVSATGLALAGAGLVASLVYLGWTRESERAAAAQLDAAAGLRERLSSGQYCTASDDPFARAVCVDAEHAAGRVQVRRAIPLVLPVCLTWTGAAALLAAAMFLIPRGAWVTDEQQVARREVQRLEQTQATVKRQLDSVVQMMQEQPALDDLQEEVKALEQPAAGPLKDSVDLERDAVKRLDNLADAIKRKRDESKYDAAQAMRKALRGLKAPTEASTPVEKLNQALAKGDFKSAREEIKALQEQLATLEHEQDKELVKKMSEQLNDLAKQLENVAKNEELRQQLEQAGVDKEQLERLLNNLQKEDLDQLKEKLQQQGMSQQQIEQLQQQLQQQQSQCSKCQGMSQALAQTGAAAMQGQTGEAIEGLSQADQQLSELEQLEQEMNQLDSALSSIQDAKNGCGQCNGGQDGQGQGQGPGQGKGGMGKNAGQGRGGLAPEQATDVGFKKEKQQVHTGKGAIVGQFLVEGEQVKGEASKEFVELVGAAEREASDAVTRDRVPRQYQQAVKDYFGRVQQAAEGEADKGRRRPRTGDAQKNKSADQPASGEGEAKGDKSGDAPAGGGQKQDGD